MLQRGLNAMPAACPAACGGAAGWMSLECESLLERLIPKLRYTIIGYRYFFMKEWYTVRSDRR
ncbi:MAG TPA: hypothetical protein VLC48_05480 [Gemmatimonadota bacterium]|nr:hypothetical protein [Gemmatimonadota bacterium]